MIGNTTVYKSTNGGPNRLEVDKSRNHLCVVQKAGNGSDGGGLYVNLSNRDSRELAFELLGEQFDVTYHEDGQIILTPKREPVEEGQFYRVKSQPSMVPDFQGDPIVRIAVTHKAPQTGFKVELKNGRQTHWHNRDLLEGPLEVVEVPVETRWVEKESLPDFG